MDGSFLAELLGQVIQPLQTSDLIEEPLLVSFLCSLQSVPRSIDILQTQYRNSYCQESKTSCVEYGTNKKLSLLIPFS